MVGITVVSIKLRVVQYVQGPICIPKPGRSGLAMHRGTYPNRRRQSSCNYSRMRKARYAGAILCAASWLRRDSWCRMSNPFQKRFRVHIQWM